MQVLRAVNIALLSAALCLIAYSATQSLLILLNYGAVSTPADLEVYWNKQCTFNCTMIDWGQLLPGSSKTMLLFIVNVGGASASLTLNTQDWQPGHAASELYLTWNYTSQTLQPLQVQPVAVTLTVADNATVSHFQFNILIGIKQ
jgi:hypothetical protein